MADDNGRGAAPGIGEELPIEVLRVVHGGHCVGGIGEVPGRPEWTGRIVFVRHALPGESVLARVTAVRRGGRFIAADAVAILSPAPGRVAPPCPAFRPGGCGGCDFAHATPRLQRSLKADVVSDALRRIGRLPVDEVPWDGVVHPVRGDVDGLRWRTRSRFQVTGSGLAMRIHGSRRLVAVSDCPIAQNAVVQAAETAARRLRPEPRPDDPPGASEVVAVAPSAGPAVAGTADELASTVITETCRGRHFEVSADGFWQVHPGAAETLVAAVIDGLRPGPGDSVLDLYGGVGLFAATVGSRTAGARIDLVEGDRLAAAHARSNLADLPDVHVHALDVRAWLGIDRGAASRRRRQGRGDRGGAGGRGGAARSSIPRQHDLVVLDPPRSGAGAEVITRIVRSRPRAVAYVACDPVALARDLRVFVDSGYRIESLRAFDLFPMTHHIESVAVLSAGAGLPEGTRVPSR